MAQMPSRRKNRTSRGWHDPYHRRERRRDGGCSVSASRRPSHSRRLSPVVLDHFRFFKASVHRTDEFAQRAETGLLNAEIAVGRMHSISGWRTLFRQTKRWIYQLGWGDSQNGQPFADWRRTACGEMKSDARERMFRRAFFECESRSGLRSNSPEMRRLEFQ